MSSSDYEVGDVQDAYIRLLCERSVPSRSLINGWPKNGITPALVNSFVAYTGPCRLFGFTVTNTKTAAQFVQVFDAATVPADTAVPLLSKSVSATDAVGFYWGSIGRWFNNGVVLCNSSTSATKTVGSADCLFDVQVM